MVGATGPNTWRVAQRRRTRHMEDQLNAFVPHGHIEIDGAAHGPLAGVAFAVKDIFDVAGVVTGRGNPDWLRNHAPAVTNAPAVDALLGTGAKLVGKTITEELAFSVIGSNPYYGTPKNVAAPGRVPARPAGRRRRSAAEWCPSPWAAILAARCGCRRATTASTACDPPMVASASMA